MKSRYIIDNFRKDNCYVYYTVTKSMASKNRHNKKTVVVNNNGKQYLSSQNNSITLFDIFKHDNILFNICSFLSVSDLRRIKKINKQNRRIISNNTYLQYRMYCQRIAMLLVKSNAIENVKFTKINKTNGFIQYTKNIILSQTSTKRIIKSPHCDGKCTFNASFVWLYNELFNNELTTPIIYVYDDIFDMTELSIQIRLTRCYHEPRNVEVYRYDSKKTIPFYLCATTYISQNVQHYITEHAYYLLQFNTENSYEILNVREYVKSTNTNKMQTAYTYNVNWYSEICNHFYLNVFLSSIPVNFYQNYLISGGSAATYIISELNKDENSDIDIFAINIDIKEHRDNILKFCKNLKTMGYKYEKKGNNCLTFNIKAKNRTIKYQFIHKKAINESDVLSWFDLSVCQIGFKLDQTIYFTEHWLITFTTGIGYYFNAYFNEYYCSHYRFKKYIQRGITKWLFSRKLLDKIHTTQNKINHLNDVTEQKSIIKDIIEENDNVYVFDFRENTNIIDSRSRVPPTVHYALRHNTNFNWDVDNILLHIIHRIVMLLQSCDTPNKRELSLLHEYIIQLLTQHKNNIKCICLW